MWMAERNIEHAFQEIRSGDPSAGRPLAANQLTSLPTTGAQGHFPTTASDQTIGYD